MRYSDLQRVDKMCVTLRKLLDYLGENGITQARILAEEPLRWAITTPLYNIGEQVYALSNTFKDAHPDIPWRAISGMRHRLVHDYERTNWTIMAEAALVEVPLLVARVKDLLEKSR